MTPFSRQTIADRAEPDLLDDVRSGDMTAYAELWRRYSGFARATARRVTSSIDADDLVSEAFVRILQAFRNGHGPRRFFAPYLRQAITTAAARWGTQQSRAIVTNIDDIERVPAGDSYSDIDDRMAVRTVVHDLSDRWRQVLWLSEVEGRSSTEVADALGISIGAARTLVYRARSGLRNAWAEHHGEVREPLLQSA